MRRDYTVLLTTLIVFTFVISGFLLFGTLDAMQADTLDCEERFKRECPIKEVPKPGLICPTPRQHCPLEETGTGTPMSKGD
ncbi:MAG: hypothetical protein OXI43_18315 [Candidatus Poribacteria bacterium]|nr:hypothetical protein [Candidatus Poribacteria bacterium]